MTKPAIRTLVLGFLCLAVSACASAGGESGPRSNPNLLTAEEMAEAPGGSLLDVVDRLRPRWLMARGATNLSGGGGQIVVFLNSSYLGGPDELRSFTTANVARLRYIEGQRAAAVLSGYPSTIYVAGAIVMETIDH